jgi:hypothetical protein
MAESNGAESIGKDWRDLCAAAVEEPDPEKLVSLVNQILQAFDEGDRKIAAHTPHDRGYSQSC